MKLWRCIYKTRFRPKKMNRTRMQHPAKIREIQIKINKKPTLKERFWLLLFPLNWKSHHTRHSNPLYNFNFTTPSFLQQKTKLREEEEGRTPCSGSRQRDSLLSLRPRADPTTLLPLFSPQTSSFMIPDPCLPLTSPISFFPSEVPIYHFPSLFTLSKLFLFHLLLTTLMSEKKHDFMLITLCVSKFALSFLL